jgi:hypothetical protein
MSRVTGVKEISDSYENETGVTRGLVKDYPLLAQGCALFTGNRFFNFLILECGR